MVIMAPDEAELMHMVTTTARYNDGPLALRFPRGEGVETRCLLLAKPLKSARADLA